MAEEQKKKKLHVWKDDPNADRDDRNINPFKKKPVLTIEGKELKRVLENEQ